MAGVTAVDWIAIWLFTFGVWPLADPGHSGDTLLSVLDIAIHIAAAVTLCMRWKLVRRTTSGGRS